MIEGITIWASDHQSIIPLLVFALGVFVAIISYLVRHFLLKDKSNKTLTQQQKGGDDSTNLQSGRDINVDSK